MLNRVLNSYRLKNLEVGENVNIRGGKGVMKNKSLFLKTDRIERGVL